MKNDKNNFSKRTVKQINAILKANGINADVANLGDGNYFSIYLVNEIKNRFALKQMGFILETGKVNDKFIDVRCY